MQEIPWHVCLGGLFLLIQAWTPAQAKKGILSTLIYTVLLFLTSFAAYCRISSIFVVRYLFQNSVLLVFNFCLYERIRR